MMQSEPGMEMRENATAEVESDPNAERRRRMLAQMLSGAAPQGSGAYGPAMSGLGQLGSALATSFFTPAMGGVKGPG